MVTQSVISRQLILGLTTTVFLLGCGQDRPQTKLTPEPARSEVSRDVEFASSVEPAIAESPSAEPPPKDVAEDSAEEVAADKPVEVKPLSEQDREQLLGRRFRGGMQYSFRQFANMFLVTSHLDLGAGIGLMTQSSEIAKIELQSPFP